MLRGNREKPPLEPLFPQQGGKMNGHGTFGTAINCMDGRVQIPLINWIKQHYNVDYVDVITEPGPEKILNMGAGIPESIKVKSLISVKAHGSDLIVIAAHHDCAGHQVTKDEHCAKVRGAIQVVRSWNLPVAQIVGVWIDENWKVDLIDYWQSVRITSEHKAAFR